MPAGDFGSVVDDGGIRCVFQQMAGGVSSPALWKQQESAVSFNRYAGAFPQMALWKRREIVGVQKKSERAALWKLFHSFSLFCTEKSWTNGTRTHNDRTKTCSVTITPWSNALQN